MIAYSLVEFAQAASPTGLDITKYLAQYGIFGAIMFDVFVTRKFITPRWSRDEAVQSKVDVIADRDKTIAEKNNDIAELKVSLTQLQSLTRDQMLPALVRANQLSADYLEEITRRDSEPRPRSPRKPRTNDQ